MLIAILVISSVTGTSAQQKDSIISLLKQYDYQNVVDLINENDSVITDQQLLYYKVAALNRLIKYRQAIPCY